MVRPLEEQIGKMNANRARKYQERIRKLRMIAPGMQYHCYELVVTIESGLCLASLMLLTTLVESNLRYSLIRLCNNSDAEIIYEEGRNGYSVLVDEAIAKGIITDKQSSRFKAYYKDIRIPLHHGLPRRTAVKLADSFCEDIFGSAIRNYRIEESINKSWLNLIGQGIALLEMLEVNA